MIRPLGARVLIRRTETPAQSKGGIIVLGRELPAHGIVLRVGPKVDDLKEGDEVTFDKWATDSRTFGPDGNLLLLDYSELFLRIRRD